jgi:peptide/nickel transport system permease protein
MSDIVLVILSTTSLSFLGLGVQPPTPEWGSMIAEGRPFIMTAWWLVTLPGMAIVLVGLGLSLLGDGLADVLRTEE